MFDEIEFCFFDLFETEALVIPCTSGTAANYLALSFMVEPISSLFDSRFMAS
jgi:threonine aldolase